MKKLKRFFGLFTTIALALVMAFGVVACDQNPDNPPPEETTVTVAITGGADTISKDQTMTLSATVSGTDNQAVTWKVSDPTTLRITDAGVVTVLSEPEILNKLVTITATSVADTRAMATKTITVLAPKKDGQVGYLTTAMLADISGNNITVSGTVTDRYTDTHESANNRTNIYNINVKMEEGKWSGSWQSDGGTALSDTYYKGAKDDVVYTVVDQGDEVQTLYNGHSIEKEIISKDNVVVRKPLTDYRSKPVAWEAQHYWNHMSSFNNLISGTRFTYDAADPTRYEYTVDENKAEELFLMAYLAQSFTPMLDSATEWFRTVVFVLDANHEKIVAVDAQTNPSYSGAETDKQGNVIGYDTMAVSDIHLTFSDAGTTQIVGKTAYTAPENADKLTAALDKMKAATSYRFTAVENTLAQAMPSDDDYTVDYNAARTLNAAREGTPTFTFNDNPYNYKSASGSVGLKGYVTPEALVLARTGKYSSAMDDKLFHTEYSGYRQFDGYYEEFEYYVKTKKQGEQTVVDKQGLQGVRRMNGTFAERVLPTFSFSANLFECVKTDTSGSTTLYTFRLREADITRDIAQEISMHSYAEDGTADSAHPMQIVVDSNGNMVSSSFPFEITTAYGIINTTYSDIGSTAINLEKVDTNYVERGEMATWDKYEMKFYRDENGEDVRDDDGMVIYPDAATAIVSMYGANASFVPAPTLFKSIFDDYMYGPFYDGETKEIAGVEKYVRYMSVKCESQICDENKQLPDDMFAGIHTKIDQAMKAAGYDPIPSKTDVTGGPTGDSDRVMVYANQYITIRVENNHTKFFDFEIYLTSDYTR